MAAMKLSRSSASAFRRLFYSPVSREPFNSASASSSFSVSDLNNNRTLLSGSFLSSPPFAADGDALQQRAGTFGSSSRASSKKKVIVSFPSRVAEASGNCSSTVSVGRLFFSSSASRGPHDSPETERLPPLPPPPPPENPPDAVNPDPVTLQEQWRYATRMYSKWYAHAWGTAIMAGLSFYALGWFLKGENPLTFKSSGEEKEEAK